MMNTGGGWSPACILFISPAKMLYTLLFAGTILFVVAAKYLWKSSETCPDCGQTRIDENPICSCGWVYEYPDDENPLEYGDPNDAL